MRATLNAGMPESRVPSNSHVPEFGLSKPHSRLNSVVLPAPLGPMSAVMALRGISRCSTSTAVRPPNRRVMLSIAMIGSTLDTPGTNSPVAMPVFLGRRRLPVVVGTDPVAGGAAGAASVPLLTGCNVVSSEALFDKGQLPLVSEDALRAED